MLQLKNIIKHYYAGSTKVEALKGINLAFRKNEFVSILGPSGCGKTTLLNIIGGLDRYTSGDLMINGKSTKDFTDYDWDSYRNYSIGFVFQSYNLIPHLNVLGNVELALTLSGVSKEERRKRAIDALNKVGLADQVFKKPNQLSGGQMQRVAIARALVNDPDILLADEPTGALDSETSVQIMEILKEIAKSRLIIMVTHNPNIANTYSTRIIRLLDGRVTDDSNPYQSEETIVNKDNETDKTAMSFLTALSLSFKNLVTKKARTFLTAFAGSIGIIGIALVLALSNGFQTYVNKMQADTLSSYPLSIAEESFDYSSMMQRFNRRSDGTEFPSEQLIYINKLIEKLESTAIRNNLTDDYIKNAIETIDPSLYNSISYSHNVKLNIYKETQNNDMTFYQPISTSVSRVGAVWQELFDNEAFITSQYDILAGKLPTNKNEIVVIVDKYNQLADYTVLSLGLYNTLSELDSYTFDDILGLEYKIILNDNLYQFDGTKYSTKLVNESIYNSGETLTVVGIIRPNPETTQGALTGSIGYTKELTDFILDNASTSKIVEWQLSNPSKDVFTGNYFIEKPTSTIEEQYKNNLRRLGGITTPSAINIYPVDFEAKTLIKQHLDQYNATQENEEDKVFYSDLMETMFSTINNVINTISYILIAFTAISLLVSSIMIGIITYISVLERTKEIGILRSIGARKKDISRVFNAETLIIGFTAGLIGILVTFLLSIPINMIISRLANVKGIASLNPIHALVLILISMFLTLIAGLIPSRIAAKKDPVVALRTE